MCRQVPGLVPIDWKASQQNRLADVPSVRVALSVFLKAKGIFTYEVAVARCMPRVRGDERVRFCSG
jgi:hypothetical protein